ncbi:hypothetical protein CHU93_05585 [Sandarakinorhabdus cyanobacteriorum]|uniref:DUF1905 domain-containing protein n=1 Tax=Sandarakinorhabdus cyanobacteriorum TaxID=1981098 RepID=A0A255YR04_9SPHN|nr:DUF1905 domain-containing protein [Sandarakinorhabdus cyanobacteriorum]OYQ31055.1 hypothetical protein CHU93_05585 [Sandarakinorhabdus cyanobacteriorum]
MDPDLDPELIRFLREELGHDLPAGGAWTFTGPLWIWKGKSADNAAAGGKPSPMSWHFLTITGPVADGIRAGAPGRSAAWGSVYVKVRLGGTSWATSVFPSKEAGGYLLPVKAAVRKKEGVGEGDTVTVELSL